MPRFFLDQKEAEQVLFNIKTLFGFGGVRLRADTNQVYRYTNNSFKGLASVKNYFLKFPLKTKKSSSFILWYGVYCIVLTKEHLTHENLENIKKIAKQVNLVNSLIRATGSALIPAKNPSKRKNKI